MTRLQDRPKKFYTIVCLTPYPRHVDGVLYESYPEAHDAVEELLTDEEFHENELFIMRSWQKATRKGVLFESLD